MKVPLIHSAYHLETLPSGKMQGVLAGKITDSKYDTESSYILVGGKSVSEFVSRFSHRKVWCIWVVSDTFITPERATMMGVERAIGVALATRGDVFSDPTGYLWTDDEGKIGGHDIAAAIACHAGKYAFIVIRQDQIDLSKITFE